MSNESVVNEEIAVLEWMKMQKVKGVTQSEEFAKLPKLIYVTYLGPSNQFMHTGRSRSARREPFRFQKDLPYAITKAEDVKFFIQKCKVDKGFPFKVEEMTPAKIAKRTAMMLIQQAKIQEAKAKIIEEEEAEKIRADAEDAKALQAEAIKLAKEELAEEKAQSLIDAEAAKVAATEELARKKAKAIKSAKPKPKKGDT